MNDAGRQILSLTGAGPEWHAAGIVLVVMLFVLRRRVAATNIVFICLFALPGVVLHELSHLGAGLAFRARPSGFSLIPERVAGGWRLGSVSFGRVTALNAVPIALAPLSLLVVAAALFLSWGRLFPLPSFPNTMGLYATMFVLMYESVPSPQDLRIACNRKSVLLYGTIAVAALCGYRYLSS